ncbi:MAG: FAD-dependent oxidoreductase, partial [Myxococcota bacterium]|nr:FAD-dependent oxidoreductase [Myxococcota bacterium]
MSKVHLSINGRPVEADASDTILDAARRLGIHIPTLCHVDGLEPYGSCFLCVVQVAGFPRLSPACSTLVSEGMQVQTESEDIAASRRMCLELLFSDHLGDCFGPCQTACPCHIDIPGFVRHARRGELSEAIALIKQRLAQPASLGRVCPRPCEDDCRRGLVEEPIAICSLKRYLADADQDAPADFVPQCKEPTGKRITVVGAGPAGVAAAFYSAIEGHQVRILEAQSAGGGMMRYGIPSYRLPRAVIDRELSVLERMGVVFEYGVRLGEEVQLDALRAQSDAVFLGVGAWSATAMRIPGESLDGVISGIDFLAQVSKDENTRLKPRVVVVGGGNTAIDAARTALRCGATQVDILYRRTRAEMPAFAPEIDDALAEGVRLQLLAAPLEVRKAANGLELYCQRMQLGAPDASGRRRPEPLPGSEFSLEVDHVIAAIGQGISPLGIDGTGLKLSRWGSIVVNEETMQSSLPDVFAGGDCVSGADIAVRAAAAGQRAAIAMDQFVRGETVRGEATGYAHRMEKHELTPLLAQLEHTPKRRPKHLPPAEARHSFAEFESVFPRAEAESEAKRCLACGCDAVNDCGIREYASRYEVNPSRFAGAVREYHLDDSHPSVRFESHKCILCANCVRMSEKLGLEALGLVRRGFATRVAPPLGQR